MTLPLRHRASQFIITYICQDISKYVEILTQDSSDKQLC